MSGIRRLAKSIRKLDVKKVDQVIEYPGLLGVYIKDKKLVEVPNRAGYVYVRLRSNLNEVIQAYNGKVSPIYDLPVLVSREKSQSRYLISGRDLGLYEDWGSSPYLPRHGAQHSFSDENFGGDIVWVYDRQFMPLSVSPSGTSGANNVVVNGDVIYWNGTWSYVGGTGTADMFAYKPTGAYSRVVLVYIDPDGNPTLSGGDPILDPNLTGIAQVIPYLPSLSTSDGIPLGAVRLLSGTSRITWQDIYDLRPLLSQSNWVTPYQIQDEGVTRNRRSYLNFKGALIWAVDNPGSDSTDVILSGTYPGHAIQESGVTRATRTYLNFTGSNLYAVDNPGNDSTDIIISGSAGSKFVPLDDPWTSSSYDGDPVMTGTYLLEISTFSSAPPESETSNYSAYYVRLSGLWDAVDSNYWIGLKSGSGSVATVLVRPQVASLWNDVFGIVKCDTSGNVMMDVAGYNASGTQVQICGYFL